MHHSALWLLAVVAFIASAVQPTSAQTATRQEETLWLQYENQRIYGKVWYPADSKEKHPVAIISHGFNGTHHSGYAYSAALNEMGYICYALDFPGGSLNSRSDNNTMNMSVRDQQHYLEGVVRYFQSRPDVNPKQVVLIGESQGGLVSALTAAAMPKRIAGLILIYPALCIPDNWEEYRQTGAAVPDTVRIWNVPLSRHYFQALTGMDVYNEIKAYKRPVLIIHGDNDQVVPIDYSRRAAEEYRRAKLFEIEQAGHGFNAEQMRRALGWITDYLH